MPTELLSIQPGELKFPFELKKQISSSLRLVNSTDNYVAFKVKTTSPKKYCVRPNTGIVQPHSSADVTVTMQAQREAPPDMQCKDKFIVQSVIAPSSKEVSQEMFNKEEGKDVHEAKLKVLYVSPPQPPSPVTESNEEEGLSPKATAAVDNGERHHLLTDPQTAKTESELKFKLNEAKAALNSLTEERNQAVQQSRSFQQELEVGSKHEEMSGMEVGDCTGPGLSYDVMTTGPSAPATPTSGWQTPISKLLSPTIVSMYGGILVSFTIWDHCLEELNADKDGDSPAKSADNLLRAFQPLLAESVLCQIRETLDALQDSTLGVEAALVYSKKSILRNILRALKERAYPSDSDADVVQSERWQTVRGRARRPATRSLGMGLPVSDRGKDGRRGSHGRQSDNDGDDDNLQSEWRRNGQYFRTIEQVLVNLDEYTTPANGNEEQNRVKKLSIAQRARRFYEHPEVGLNHVTYIPSDVDGSACFYHGTRLSSVQGFSRYGVQPFKSETEFSPLPAFYVTNNVVAAFEFPFHNHLASDPSDTIVVFRFELDLHVLHGDEPPPSNRGKRFKVRWFETGLDDTAWKNFCMYNMYEKEPKSLHDYDIVIGAMCFPNGQMKTVSPRSEEDLLQVAFCSKAAWKWVGSCVTRMYVENRMAL